MRSDRGFIKLHRSILNNPLWNEDRSRTKAEAWLDLLMSAWYSEDSAKVIVGNKTLIYYRGEVYASLRFLAESWQWSKNKVDGFLTYLESESMIQKRTDKGTGRTIITICKYDDYNPKSNSEGFQKGHEKDTTGTASGQHRDTTGTNKKEDKKEKKDKEDDVEAEKNPTPSAQLFTLKNFEKEIEIGENEFSMLAVRRTKRTLDQLRAFLPVFVKEQKGLTKVVWQSSADARSHFINWVNKQPIQVINGYFPQNTN